MHHLFLIKQPQQLVVGTASPGRCVLPMGDSVPWQKPFYLMLEKVLGTPDLDVTAPMGT